MEPFSVLMIDEPLIDAEELLGRCMGNLPLMQRLLNNFVKHLGSDLASLKLAVEHTNLTEVARLAHKVKGTALSVSALGLARAAEILESSVAKVEVTGLSEIVSRMEHEKMRIVEFINPSCSAANNG